MEVFRAYPGVPRMGMGFELPDIQNLTAGE
jgi:hypothetical protein